MKFIIAQNFDLQAHAVVYSGDCLDLLSQVPDESMALVITSPPLERPVYDPQGTNLYIPPKVVNLRAIWETPPLIIVEEKK